MSPTGQEVSVQNHDEVAIIAPTGELDLAATPAFRESIERALGASPTALEIDLADVTFLDSSSLSVIVNAWQESTERGIRFRLRNPVRTVRRVLEITDLDLLLDDP